MIVCRNGRIVSVDVTAAAGFMNDDGYEMNTWYAKHEWVKYVYLSRRRNEHSIPWKFDTCHNTHSALLRTDFCV